jgi:D-sedoheptulose 7-phosphate isomerase
MIKNNNISFINDYLNNLNTLSKDLDVDSLIKICKTIIKTANSKGTVIIVGNGGSSSISSHVAVDFLKAVGIRAMTFNESSLITCYANDYGYENWVKEALKSYVQINDTIILISSSGESSNIINAAKYVKSKNLNLVTFSGFNMNNSLSILGDFNIWVNSKDYNYVEILHNQFLLMLVDLVKLNLKK